MAEERRTWRRDAGLFAVAFLATLVLIAGLVVAMSPRPGATGSPIAGVSGSPAAGTGTPGSPTAGGASGGVAPSGPASPPATLPPAGDDPVLVGAGDIGDCNSDGDEATAALLDAIPGTVFTTGDNAYPSGRERDFTECYDPSWGRHRERTRPAPGNHDFRTADGAAYFDYFGASAVNADGDPWYSYDLGGWHIIVLDSRCDTAEDCGPDSDQGRWLAADLAANDAACTMAIWHVPRFSSGFHGDDTDIDPFWRALYDAGADVIVNGHDHDYERFAPQDPDGNEDRERGIREFVVGTGGTALRPFEETAPNSELRAAVSQGVLRFILRDDRYDWEFIPTSGPFSDQGSAACN